MIARKYANSLFKSLEEFELVEVYEAIAKLAMVANNPKFLLIVNSPIIDIEEKAKVLSKIVEIDNEKFLNFIKILLTNKRIKLIKEIYNALRELVSQHFNTYAGFVDGNISTDTLEAIEKSLSKKFNKEIKLQIHSKKDNGIKIFIDILNLELAIDENRVKENLINTILRAI